jgi:hypothetical protein
MPDDALFALAANGTLQDDAVLGGQVDRMLLDSKAQTLVEVFASQWFELSVLATHETDAMLFPQVTPDLKLAMQTETKLFFEDVLQSGGTMRSLVAADHTFVNAALAQHYGLPAPPGTSFAKVSVTGTNRLGGLLGHASVLMQTSNADSTSPVKRGAWVLTNILCSPPPPPPPNVVTQLPAANPEAGLLTTRERLAAHRQNPTCATCHDLLDPVGLGLENYDAVGAYRTTEGGQPIDASGQLPGGATFKNGFEMAALLADDPRVHSCVAQKLFTFALGRAPAEKDAPYVQTLTSSNSDTVRQVLRGLVLSDPFRSRHGGTTP